MRPETQAKIDALHAEIAELVAAEKSHYDAQMPDAHPLARSVAHTKIDFAARSPQHRDQMVYATATMPVRRPVGAGDGNTFIVG